MEAIQATLNEVEAYLDQQGRILQATQQSIERCERKVRNERDMQEWHKHEKPPS